MSKDSRKLLQIPNHRFSGLAESDRAEDSSRNRVKPRVCTGGSGFTLIEVLVGLLVLVGGIVSISSAMKAYTDARQRQDLYQEFYMTGLSLMSRLRAMDLEDNLQGTGRINDFEYHYKARQIASAKNFVWDALSGTGGNTGSFALRLLAVEVVLDRRNFSRSFQFYVARYEGTDSDALPFL